MAAARRRRKRLHRKKRYFLSRLSIFPIFPVAGAAELAIYPAGALRSLRFCHPTLLEVLPMFWDRFRSRQQARPERPSFRPVLESLEERRVPSASPLQQGNAMLQCSKDPCIQRGCDIVAAEIGLQVMFTGMVTVNPSLIRAGAQLTGQGLAAYIGDSVACGMQELNKLLVPSAQAATLPQQPQPQPIPTPTPPVNNDPDHDGDIDMY
jgi:hypothetical protein